MLGLKVAAGHQVEPIEKQQNRLACIGKGFRPIDQLRQKTLGRGVIGGSDAQAMGAGLEGRPFLREGSQHAELNIAGVLKI